MWLFLATEVMFFTGLIGSYIVLRAGSPHTSYSNIYPPGTPLQGLGDTKGIVIHSVGSDPHRIEQILRTEAGLKPEQAELIIEAAPHGVVPGRPAEKAEALEQPAPDGRRRGRSSSRSRPTSGPSPTTNTSTRWPST